MSQPKRNPALTSRKYLLTGHLECTYGAPAVGTCLNHTYRYYRCRSTWPTATRPKTCDAPYINAGKLEDAVWRTVREILQEPELVVAEIKQQQGESSFIEEEITRVTAAVRRLADQERRLIRLFGLAQVTEEYLNKGDLVRRSTGGVCGDRKTSAVCHSPLRICRRHDCHELRTLRQAQGSICL